MMLPRYLLLLLVPLSPVWADPPAPPSGPLSVTITSPAGVPGDGSRLAPFSFACGSKGKLGVTTTADQLSWILDDAPLDTEVLPGDKLLWFPTDTPGLYVVFVSVSQPIEGPAPPAGRLTAGARCWLEIKAANGPAPSPSPVTLKERMKAALKGPDAAADAVKFEAAVTVVADAIEQQQIRDTGQMEQALKAALDANQWVTGRYPLLSKLMGELFGENVPVQTFTLTTRQSTTARLREIAQACRSLRNP